MIKNLILAAVAVLGLSAASAGGPEFDPAGYALDYACSVHQVDCSDFEVPRIQYAHLRDFMGVLGYYWHSRTPDTVFLDISFREGIEAADMTDSLAWSVLVHEVTHYVDLRIHEGITSCQTETRAFRTSNLWLLEHGYYKQARWGWWKAYPRCNGNVEIE